jgi:hypothetical protein
MKTTLTEQKSRDEKKFRDFAMFSVYVVRPGAVFTPRESDRKRRPRVTPLRSPTRRPYLSAWDRLHTVYVGYRDVGVATARTKKGEENVEATEMEQWAASARRSRLSWMDENPY